MGSGNCCICKVPSDTRVYIRRNGTTTPSQPRRTWGYVCPICYEQRPADYMYRRPSRKVARDLFWAHVKSEHGGVIGYFTMFDLPYSGGAQAPEVSTSL